MAIKPDEHLALSGWGTALFYQAKTKTGPEADALFMLAEQKCLLTEDIRPGAGSYNLARIASLRADAEVAAKWLKHSHEKALDFPGCAHIAADSDFDKVRDSEAFQQALRDIGCGV